MALTGSEEVEIEKLASFERMRIFTSRAKRGAVTAPLGIAFLALVQAPYCDATRILSWVCLMLVIEVGIYSAALAFDKRVNKANISFAVTSVPVMNLPFINVPVMKLQVFMTLVAGLGWGSSVWFFYSGQEVAYTANLATLTAVAGISMLVMTPIRSALILYSLGLVLPPIVQAYLLDHPAKNFVAGGLTVLFTVQISYGFQMLNELKQAMRSWVSNTKLIENLARSEEALREKNARL